MAISTNGTVIARLAGGLYNTQLSNATYNEVTAIITTTASLNALANDLYARDFAASTDLTVAKTLLANLSLSSVAGLDAWVAAQITAAGAANKGAKIVELLNSFAQMTSDATYGSAAAAFNTKTANSLELSQTSGNLGGTFEAASVSSSKTFTLTTSVNNETGTSGNDTFSGGAGTIDGDVLVGGSGTDTLNLTVDNADDNNATFSATSIENVSIRTTATAGGVSLDMGDVTGVETLTANRLLTALTLTDVQDIADIAVDRNTANAALTITYAADVVAGTADSLTLTVTNSSNAGTVTIDGIETVNLVSTDNPTDDTNEIQIDAAGSGTATEVLNISGAGDLTVVATDALTINSAASGDVELTATAATEVNHTGSGELDVTVGAAVDATVSAADSTGTLTVTANGAGDLTITGSAQADTFEFGATLTNDDTVDGGDGVDTLQILGDGVTSVEAGDVTVSNVETLEILGDTNADSLDFDVFSAPAAIATVIVTATDDTDDVTLADVQATTYTIRNAATANAADDMDDVNIDLKDSSGTADAITVNIQNRQLGTANNQEAFTLTTLEAAGVESMTLNATRVSTAGTAEDITITNFTTVDLESLTLAGNADLTISSTLDDETVTIDAAGFTGALDVTVGTNGVTYTGGSGADTVRFGTRLTTTDTVTGGEGNDTVVATLSAGTVSPTLSGVETLSVNFNGGALSGANLGEVSTLTVNTSTAAGVASNLSSTVATVNQQDDAVSLAFNYAAGAAATVTMNFLDDDAATISNTATQFSNVANLTIAGGNGDASDATVALGSLSIGAATSLTVTSDDDTGDTLNTGNVTAASIASLSVAADEANITLGTVAAANLATLSLVSTGAGDVIVGAITAGNDVTSVTISSTVDGLVNLDDITATDSDITTFTINLDGSYGTSDLDRVVADNITTLSISTTSDGTSLDIEDFVIDESIGSITFNTGDDFTGGNAFIDTGATGTIGDITITATDTFTVAADNVFINDAITVGNISITASGDGTGVNLGSIDEATTVGNITIVANDDVEFDGADAATSVGDISVTVASGKTVDMNDAATGTTNGVIGTITASGAGSFTLQIGAVTSMGTIDLSGLSGTSDIALSNTTTIGVVATLGAGADTFVGTGGADVITAGLGADVITGGSGADNISLTEATASVDNVIFSAVADNGSDSITGFTFGTGGDTIDVELLGAGDVDAEVAVAAGGTVADAADAETVYVFADGATASGGETIADYTDLVDVLAFLNAALTIEQGDVDGVAVINDLVNDLVYVYNLDVDATDDTDIESITLVGTISAANSDTAFTTANTVFA